MNPSHVIITGASSGIGRACAHAFAELGSNLSLWARRQDRLQELAEELTSRHGITVHTATVDVRHLAEVRSAVASLPAPFQSPDVLVNNAGLSRGLVPLQEGEIQDWEEMIDTNIKGLLYVTRSILPNMVNRATGLIVNIASIAGIQPYRGGNVYGATKAAVKMLSDSLQIDVNGTGVRICNIDPGLVETEFSQVRFHGDTDRAATVYKGYQPLSGRDIADCVIFAATRPAHVSIQDILITPTAQASVNLTDKRL
ncbi:MAG: SDR family NAD(P)-dependent oxidoreductase [Candidatus Kapabacteria bacterium]|nr:SDR family NAD(P)-dependent oxidoreductase [Candidatus Kapabacteria bacterium]